MFSAGAASAVACLLAEPKPDVIVYCDTGSEHEDNNRFIADCEAAFGWQVQRLRSKEYRNTWDVWERTRWLAGHKGARCSAELKRLPRLEFQRPGDTNIVGYTADPRDRNRAARMRKVMFEVPIETPLIDLGLTKAACLAVLERRGVRPPITYSMGFHNANCMPCVKAVSAGYWANVRKHMPAEFERMAKLSRELNVKLAYRKGCGPQVPRAERYMFIDQIPASEPCTDAIAPRCDFLCELTDTEEANQ